MNVVVFISSMSFAVNYFCSMWHLTCATFLFEYFCNTRAHTEKVERVKRSGSARVNELTDAFVEAGKSTISGEHDSHTETSECYLQRNANIDVKVKSKANCVLRSSSLSKQSDLLRDDAVKHTTTPHHKFQTTCGFYCVP